MLQEHTLIHTQSDPKPLQIGEPFHCWECGSLDQGGMFLIIDHSPLEVYTDTIYYMRLTCGHNPRCVRLGDAIAPLCALDRLIDENLACVREGLTQLAKAVSPDRQNQEAVPEFDHQVKQIVYLLVAGRISPPTAIYQLRGLIAASPLSIPVSKATWR